MKTPATPSTGIKEIIFAPFSLRDLNISRIPVGAPALKSHPNENSVISPVVPNIKIKMKYGIENAAPP